MILPGWRKVRVRCAWCLMSQRRWVRLAGLTPRRCLTCGKSSLINTRAGVPISQKVVYHGVRWGFGHGPVTTRRRFWT